MLYFGKLYKLITDVLRRSNLLTYLVFGVKVSRKQIKSNWDLTTLVLEKAINEFIIGENNKKILDMGCGHIALLSQYIKKNNKSSNVIGVDVYRDFVKNSIFNISKNSLNVTIKQSDLYDKIKGKFDFIIFNPPYVPTNSKKINYPKATFSGKDGTYVIRKFLKNSKKHLNVDGKILLGINCFYVPFEKMLKIIKDNNYILKKVVARKFNTARVFVLEAN